MPLESGINNHDDFPIPRKIYPNRSFEFLEFIAAAPAPQASSGELAIGIESDRRPDPVTRRWVKTWTPTRVLIAVN